MSRSIRQTTQSLTLVIGILAALPLFIPALAQCATPSLIGYEAMKLENLPYFRPNGTRSMTNCPADPTGGNTDWGNQLYNDANGDKVVFDVAGKGWMNLVWANACNSDFPVTYGNIKIYFDNETIPTINMPVVDFYRTVHGAFVSPLAGATLCTMSHSCCTGTPNSHYCHVPLAFTNGIKIAYSGQWQINGDGGRAFWQNGAVLLPPSASVTRWTGNEDNSAIINAWTHLGSDTKDSTGNTLVAGTKAIAVGDSADIAGLQGVGVIQRLKIKVNPATDNVLANVMLRIYWDGESNPSVDVPIGWFFGRPGIGTNNNTGVISWSSLPLGMDTAQFWYCYFPMPYWKSAKIRIVNKSSTAISQLSYQITYSTTTRYAEGTAGYFHASTAESGFPGHIDGSLLRAKGRGHFVGIIAEHCGDNESDYRVYFDGNKTPQIYSDGSEELYLTGYGWVKGLHSAVNGTILTQRDGGWSNPIVGYRFFIGDPAVFNSDISFGLEAQLCGRVAYYYMVDSTNLLVSDSLDIGNTLSESAHAYKDSGETWHGSSSFQYEGEFENVAISDDGRSLSTSSNFTVAINPQNDGVRLRRRMDQSVNRQKAEVYVDNTLAGIWYVSSISNAYKRWRDVEFEIPASMTQGKKLLAIRIKNIGTPAWSEYRYWVFCYKKDPVTAIESITDAAFGNGGFSARLKGSSIRISVPRTSDGTITRLQIFDLQGKLIRTLTNSIVTPGSHVYDLSAISVTGGQYIFRMQSGTSERACLLTVVR